MVLFITCPSHYKRADVRCSVDRRREMLLRHSLTVFSHRFLNSPLQYMPMKCVCIRGKAASHGTSGSSHQKSQFRPNLVKYGNNILQLAGIRIRIPLYLGDNLLTAYGHGLTDICPRYSRCGIIPCYSMGHPRSSKARRSTLPSRTPTFTYHWQPPRYSKGVLLAGIYSLFGKIWYSPFVSSSSFYNLSHREYFVLPCLWNGHRCTEYRGIYEGSP